MILITGGIATSEMANLDPAVKFAYIATTARLLSDADTTYGKPVVISPQQIHREMARQGFPMPVNVSSYLDVIDIPFSVAGWRVEKEPDGFKFTR